VIHRGSVVPPAVLFPWRDDLRIARSAAVPTEPGLGDTNAVNGEIRIAASRRLDLAPALL